MRQNIPLHTSISPPKAEDLLEESIARNRSPRSTYECEYSLEVFQHRVQRSLVLSHLSTKRRRVSQPLFRGEIIESIIVYCASRFRNYNDSDYTYTTTGTVWVCVAAVVGLYSFIPHVQPCLPEIQERRQPGK